jgi:hypothetical protein
MTAGPIIVATSSLVAASSPSIWQRRYWEHTIRDENDFARHVDYVHINPVKHGLVTQVVDWPHSSFHRIKKLGVYPRGLGWRCLGSWRCVRRTAGRTRGEMMGIASLHHPTRSDITPSPRSAHYGLTHHGKRCTPISGIYNGLVPDNGARKRSCWHDVWELVVPHALGDGRLQP